jgi:uncharacterized membrane-anchored protein
MATHSTSSSTRITIDLGASTIIMLSELILIVLKILGYIPFSWELVLSPIILVLIGSVTVLLFTLIKIIKDNLF